VTDDGCGMSAETRSRIFDPFFTTKPVDVGTGLGLSVVHGIVQSHHGAITVHSEIGRGSSFRIYLPAAKEATGSRAAQAPARRSSVTTGRTILYVDDEEALVFLIERLLRRIGHRVSGFTSAEDALARFREAPQSFDIVVTDASMPGMTGFEFAEAVLAVRSDTPVIMTTGYTHESDRERAARIGVRAVILKPDTVDELCDVINDIAAQAS
jgi:CheY-like chemotaxis protein